MSHGRGMGEALNWRIVRGESLCGGKGDEMSQCEGGEELKTKEGRVMGRYEVCEPVNFAWEKT